MALVNPGHRPKANTSPKAKAQSIALCTTTSCVSPICFTCNLFYQLNVSWFHLISCFYISAPYRS
ncbi:hypothetical protein Hanom_Chr11g01034621 [Helianthus anomalus]